MLIIRSVHFLPDGRSVVDTVGGKRFRVLSRGMKDGYSIADIEHLEDTRVRLALAPSGSDPADSQPLFNKHRDERTRGLRSKLQLLQVEDGSELTRLQELHDDVYEQARVWFQNLKIRFRNQILQHFGPMPEREADIQVNTEFGVLLLQRVIYSRRSLTQQDSSGSKQGKELSASSTVTHGCRN